MGLKLRLHGRWVALLATLTVLAALATAKPVRGYGRLVGYGMSSDSYGRPDAFLQGTFSSRGRLGGFPRGSYAGRPLSYSLEVDGDDGFGDASLERKFYW